jgi:2-phospho-L-lactate/phosphoenolpyruvate guanylyltransferase
VVIPIKGGPAAKSRLSDLDDSARQIIADAMALDVVAAALMTPVVDRVVVVTNDPHVGWAVKEMGAQVVSDPAAGLNEAIAAPAFDGPWAALLGDLPALTTAALTEALDAVGDFAIAFVPDADGTGTTLLAATHQTTTYFGTDSAARHDAAGYQRVESVPAAVRQDVDDLASLHAAAALGLGARTLQAYNDLGL